MYKEGHLCCYLKIVHVHVSCLFSLEYSIFCTSLAYILINSYGAPFGQKASYLALHSSLFGPDGAANDDCIVTNCLSETLPLVINEATKKHPNLMFRKH